MSLFQKRKLLFKEIYIYLLPKGQVVSAAFVTVVLIWLFSGGSAIAETTDETENFF